VNVENSALHEGSSAGKKTPPRGHIIVSEKNSYGKKSYEKKIVTEKASSEGTDS
jgi:hypothetical protein